MAEQQFRVEFVDGELRVFNEEGRMVLRQPKFPDGSNEAWTEAAALAWWETRKNVYIQPDPTPFDDSTMEPPEEGQ